MIALGVDVPGRRLGGWAVYDSLRDRCLGRGTIELGAGESEIEQIQLLQLQLAQLYARYGFDVVAIEHPFLYIIAQWIGVVKGWVAAQPTSRRAPGLESPLRWYMVTASSARKAVYGDAKKITRVNRNGRVVSAAKEFVLDSMRRSYEMEFTQHSADALLYAIAATRKLTPTSTGGTSGDSHADHRGYRRGARQARADQGRRGRGAAR